MKIYILSLGCAKNRVDSECLVGRLEQEGFEIVASSKDADCAIINTCGFIRPAVEENIEEILNMEELKQAGHLKKIAVVGCLFNRYGVELQREFKDVDFWAKSEDWESVVKNLKGITCQTQNCRVRGKLPTSPIYSRYLKIVEGCENKCTYCAIPSIRGGLHSLTQETIVNEAINLVQGGAKELCVVGQDLTVYGVDFDGKSHLLELLDNLEKSLPKNIWIRLLYLHPVRVSDELLERVANGTQILPYLDIPIQHADAEILSAMNRGQNESDLLRVFKTARSIRPDFALRTTCMVGFPGEKEKHFANLLRFIGEVEFDRLGAFTYYKEEGTLADTMLHHCRENTKQKRLSRLMSLQEKISQKRQNLFIGKTLKVLIEEVHSEEDYALARSYREAPDVDGVIEIRGLKDAPKISVGDFVNVKILDATPHDMIATL